MYLFLFSFSFWVKCVAEFLSQLRVFFFLKYQEHKWHFANSLVGIYHRTLHAGSGKTWTAESATTIGKCTFNKC